MGLKVPPGLIERGGVWHIAKTIAGKRIRESTGTHDLKEAERYLAHRMEEVRQAAVYGVRPTRTWREAATKYLRETTKASVKEDARHLKQLDPYIGDLPLAAVHTGTLQGFLTERKHQGPRKKDDDTVKNVSKRTKNYSLQVVRHILNLAASEWLDEYGMTWLAHAPKIKLLREDDKRSSYPLTPDEQVKLFKQLPAYLAKMALFAVNTGARDQEVCQLRWEWEVPVPELDTSVFIIPAHKVKNREEKVLVLNRVAKAVIEEMRGRHPEFVFLNSKGRPVKKMCREAWRTARKKANLPHVRVHDLRHTFGRRLRAGGVSFEDRQDLLGHKSGRITTHYSRPELENLIDAANKACTQEGHKIDTLTILRTRKRQVA